MNTNLTQFGFEMSEIWPFEVNTTVLALKVCLTPARHIARVKLQQIIKQLWRRLNTQPNDLI